MEPNEHTNSKEVNSTATNTLADELAAAEMREEVVRKWNISLIPCISRN